MKFHTNEMTFNSVNWHLSNGEHRAGVLIETPLKAWLLLTEPLLRAEVSV